ncbi:Spectinomycin tetracycline efflux pump [Streptomyces netropsis]|uniref:EmrB/QacA subfamily drug resistance transporter n=1 Tax=Streptomyces syringium TaxID=76729 RepID=A0ABS4Y1K2_9ACTN|nr:MFS transporter [Streptomyces syringium]MBP2402638.1 EmrB/QacA subfamily drug resistance transporter [Streptomyces syringium]SPE49535.1 Spectinomycin tetracycline efflux pump [Streptomyces netropsis]
MSTDTHISDGPRAGAEPGRARTITLVVVLIAELMNALDGSIVYTALPSIQADTGASSAAVQWIPAAYTLTFALALITGGRLGDLCGRKRIFLVGTGVFTLASLLCGVATGPELLIAARAVQGAAAAAMVPQVLATIHVTFDGESRAKAFGLYGMIMSLGGVLGPVLGAALTSADLLGLDWRPIFLINLPIGLATVLLGLRFLPESRDLQARRLDPLGMVLSSAGLLLIAYPLTVGGERHWPAWSFAMAAAGVVVLAVFVAQQRAKTAKDGSALVALSLFRGKAFAGGLAAQLVFGLVSGVFLLTWTLFMQEGLGFSPAEFAPGSIAVSIGGMAGAMLASKVTARQARRVPQAGAVLVAVTLVGYHLLITAQGTGLPFAAAVAPMILFGAGFGMIGAGLAGLTLGQVGHEDAGSASGLFNTAMQLGTALGIALASVVFFRHAPAGSHGATVTGAFAGTIWYVTGALVVMWGLMFLLPRRARG